MSRSSELQRTSRAIIEWLKTPRSRPQDRWERIAYDYGVRSAKALADDDGAWIAGGVLLNADQTPPETDEEKSAGQHLGARMYSCWMQLGAAHTRLALGLPDDPPIC